MRLLFCISGTSNLLKPALRKILNDFLSEFFSFSDFWILTHHGTGRVEMKMFCPHEPKPSTHLPVTLSCCSTRHSFDQRSASEAADSSQL